MSLFSVAESWKEFLSAGGGAVHDDRQRAGWVWALWRSKIKS